MTNTYRPQEEANDSRWDEDEYGETLSDEEREDRYQAYMAANEPNDIPEQDEEPEENKEMPLNEDQAMAMDHRGAKIVVTDQAAERISKESGLFGLNSAVNNDLFKKFNYQRRADHHVK